MVGWVEENHCAYLLLVVGCDDENCDDGACDNVFP